jgi:tetratricopeptide (TPR) repeat protein
MKPVLLALLLSAAPADNNPLYTLYAQGHFEDAMRQGAASGTAAGLSIASRAAMADAMMQPKPCLDCLKRGEAFARRAIAADPGYADAHIWLATSLGYEARIEGLIWARLRNDPGQAKDNLDAALKDDPDNGYALAALGGWNVEIVRAGGSFLARQLYDASMAQGLALFDRAVRAAPGNVAVRYQIGLSLAGFGPDRFHDRIESELQAAIQATPATVYEKFVQARARELLAALDGGDRDAFEDKVRRFQGYP